MRAGFLRYHATQLHDDEASGVGGRIPSKKLCKTVQCNGCALEIFGEAETTDYLLV